MALIVAAFPPTYFALRLRKSNPAYARLAGFLVVALAIHVTFHITDIFVGIPAVVLTVEALSAAFILVFAAANWKLREEG
ncbi:MAG: hypothetical protein V3W28_05650 [Thermoplasmata archaeon]